MIDSFLCKYRFFFFNLVFFFVVEASDKFQQRLITRTSDAALQAERFVLSFCARKTSRLTVHAARLCHMVRYVTSVFREKVCVCLSLSDREWTGTSLQLVGVDKAVSVHREGDEKWKQYVTS